MEDWIMNALINILILIGGLITLLGAVLNWRGMYRSRRSRGIVSFFGISGARILYGILGLLLMVIAILGLAGYFNG
jgi:hypothetical protein